MEKSKENLSIDSGLKGLMQHDKLETDAVEVSCIR